jgi:hypothetical protein
MPDVWRTRDRLDRVVVLSSSRLDHIVSRHPELAGRLDEIRAAIQSPGVVTQDDGYPHRENLYASSGAGRAMLKVVVHYRPVPPQGTWAGEVITAHPTRRVDPKEARRWP